MTRLNFLIFGWLLSSITTTVYAQEQSPPEDELKIKLNTDGSHYVKLTFLNQTWLRYNHSNPGTIVLNEKKAETFDIGLRRTRLQFFGQINAHAFFYTQFGQNNFNFLSQSAGNRKLQAFFHDVLGEYKVWKDNDNLKLGGGLTITTGLSRFSQPSASSIMTMDLPIFAQATVDQIDQLARKLSVYARGQIGKFDYRLVLSDPFPIQSNGQPYSPPNAKAGFAGKGHHKQYQGFFIFNLFNKEPHTTPYMAGTFLGKKKVFNLEAGFLSQKNATWTKEGFSADTSYHSMFLWSGALYYDAPLSGEKGNSISAYLGYFNYDFGPGFLRYNGIMNPANEVEPGRYPGSQGNAFPMFGTGQILYTQIGYLFKRDLLGHDKGTLMPYVSLMHADFELLKNKMNVLHVGVNWLIKNHNSKLTLDYQLRPVYQTSGSDLLKVDNKGQVVLQYQVFL